MHPGQSDLGDAELDNLLGSLRQFLPVPLATVDDADLLQPRRLKSVLLLVNVGVDPLRHHSQMNLHMATGRTDVLGYAGVRDNLVDLDQLERTDGAPLRGPPGAARVPCRVPRRRPRKSPEARRSRPN
ncbi:class I adenylate cyclase [Pseudomonas aeruginosa]|uniref:class I adenylate cyclase n=1 Tax=Pseudomonas aeruginosa TaxID=287 RepID=UPI0021CA4DEB|nr:class I adenylate cyclase [Pseudomonas aeruginosa]